MMHEIPEEPRTLRTRIRDVLRPDEFLPIKRIWSRLEGHTDTWAYVNTSNIRKIVQDMEAKGQVVARFNRRWHRTEYARVAVKRSPDNVSRCPCIVCRMKRCLGVDSAQGVGA